MGVTYAVVCAHVHVHALDTYGRAVEVEVEAPQRSAEGVGQAGLALVVQRVGLAHDQGHSATVGPGLVILDNVRVDRAHCARVVQERSLECDARAGGTGYIAGRAVSILYTNFINGKHWAG